MSVDGGVQSPDVASRPERIAVVHDWLTGMRGGEQILEAILGLLPAADLFTLFHFPGSVSPAIEARTIRTSFLQPVAARVADYRKLLPLFPAAIRRFDLSGYDLIVSSSHCVAKGVAAHGKPHLSYCHTPMRYIWDRFDDYFPSSRPLTRGAMSMIAPALRRWDVRTAGEVTRFLANSTFVRQRISEHYGRDADVVHPFVDQAFLAAPLVEERDDYDLVVSALVPYKLVDLAIDTATATGRPLVVIGGGPLLEAFRARRAPNVSLLGHVSRDEVIAKMSRARCLILPGIEDFGITPLEAMALGTPVVALRGGGALDTIEEGQSGIFFDAPVVESLSQGLSQLDRQKWDRAAIRAHAAAFSLAEFGRRFSDALQRTR
ncbi:MAG: glycosyltransferase [Acidobacteriota bacterium]